MDLFLLSIIDDAVSILTWTWWLWLLFLAWYFYSWAQQHVGFSPLLALSVGAILVYFLVIEHPLIGSFSVIVWLLVMSGFLYLLPMVTAFFNTVFKKPPSAGGGQAPLSPYSMYRG